MRFLADENFNGKVLSGVRKALPDIDVVRVQDTSMSGSPDPQLLEWAAKEERIVLTHDVQTMAGFANDRVRAGLKMPEIIEVKMSKSIGTITDELVLMIAASSAEEFESQVKYIPIR
jgi:predicted nuclease of predicted toxin-antitoxin system